MTLKQAEKVVGEIINDLCDRRGLRQEWEKIDEAIQMEIREEWCIIVKRESE